MPGYSRRNSLLTMNISRRRPSATNMDRDDREVGGDDATPSEPVIPEKLVSRLRLDQMINEMKARSMIAARLTALEEEKEGKRLIGVGLHQRDRIVRFSGGASDTDTQSPLDVRNSMKAHTIQVS